MKNWHIWAVTALLIGSPILVGCSSTPTERYTSPRIRGEAQKINLDEVQKAFFESQGKDFSSWMSAFEKRVNEIYDGKEIVSIDANRSSGKLVVTGFIAKTDKDGYQPGDEKLFTLEQTGDVVNNNMPYRVADSQGRTYYEGHRSIFDNPFIQMMVFSHLMGGWGGRYYTPAPQTVILRDHRDQFRGTTAYQNQQRANANFNSRFNTKAGSDQFQSRNRFGQGYGTSTDNTSRRRWGSSSGTDSSGTSMWGGRRSSGSGFSFGRRGGWGRRR